MLDFCNDSLYVSLNCRRHSSEVTLSKNNLRIVFCLQVLWNILAKKGSFNDRIELRCQRHVIVNDDEGVFDRHKKYYYAAIAQW